MTETQEIIDVLNHANECDPRAVKLLMQRPVSCNRALRESGRIGTGDRGGKPTVDVLDILAGCGIHFVGGKFTELTEPALPMGDDTPTLTPTNGNGPIKFGGGVDGI